MIIGRGTAAAAIYGRMAGLPGWRLGHGSLCCGGQVVGLSCTTPGAVAVPG
jgi:hypothetical protein